MIDLFMLVDSDSGEPDLDIGAFEALDEAKHFRNHYNTEYGESYDIVRYIAVQVIDE